jgi:ubiquilin
MILSIICYINLITRFIIAIGANRANAASTTNSNPTSTTATSTTSTTGSTGSTGGMAGDPMEAFRNAMMGAMGGAPGTTNTMPGGMNPFMSGNFGAGMPPVDPATSARMLQNPAFMRMFAEMMSQPEFQEMMTSMNPMMNTPEARAAMQSPEFRQMMSNPELLSQLMGMMPSMMPGLAMGQDVNTNIFGQSTDDGNTTNTNTVSNVPPEERYAEQLRQLNEMGFWDAEQNLRVLVAAGGNVNRAVEMILGGNV